MHPHLSFPSVSVATVEFRSGESELRKLECFKHALVVGDVTPSVAHLRMRASAPSFFASVSVSEVLGYSVALSIAVGLRRSRRVLYPQQF